MVVLWKSQNPTSFLQAQVFPQASESLSSSEHALTSPTEDLQSYPTKGAPSSTLHVPLPTQNPPNLTQTFYTTYFSRYS